MWGRASTQDIKTVNSNRQLCAVLKKYFDYCVKKTNIFTVSRTHDV